MAKAKTPKNPKGENKMKVLQFKLTDEQKAEKGLKAAELADKVRLLEIEKKALSDEFGAKIKAAKAQMNTHLKEIFDGVEDREVEAVEVKNFETNKVEYWFEGEKMAERDLTEADKQMQLGEQKKKDRAFQKANDDQKAALVETHQDTKETKDEKKRRLEIAQVHREETGQLTSRSALNGPAGTHP